MQTILFITNKYPNQIDHSALSFVQQLVWTIADIGIQCIVICPLAINLQPQYIRIPEHVMETTEVGGEVNVYFPKFFGFGQSYYVFGKSPVRLTTALFQKAVSRIVNKKKLKFDIVYGNFIAPAGIAAAYIGRKRGLPSFVSYGESTTWSIDQYGISRVKKALKDISGIVSVSTSNKDILVKLGVVSNDIIEVFPNGYRYERFIQHDRNACRRELGWSERDFIVGFVGSFDDRKGILRLQAAVDQLEDVYFVCAGKGKLTPTSNKCLYASSIQNKELPYFYSALDVFVLPTLNEGCCNAIVEAMACGCPIISSRLPFNNDILDKTCSLLVNPRSIQEIADAIEELHNKKDLRDQLSAGALEKAKNLTLKIRAERILGFMDSKRVKYK